MSKSPDAFRTISEVAEWLDTPAHVLRFWESRFRQVKPVKRAGGRRYYRPADMALLGGIKRLLHEDGMTIKGVQKILRDKGVKHVADMSMDVDSEIEQSDIDAAEARLMASIEEPKEKAEVVAAPVAAPAAKPEVKAEPEQAASPVPETAPEADEKDATESEEVEASPAPKADEPDPAPTAEPEPSAEPTKAAPKDNVPPAADDPVQLDLLAEPSAPKTPEPKPETKPVEEPAASVVEDAVEPEEVAAKDEPKETKPAPFICDVPDDPTDESLVVDGTADDTALVMLLAADPEDFAGKSTALRALLDRISGADGKLADGV